MFGLSFTEILIITAIALIVIGPKKLPSVARAMGKGFSEFKGALDDVKRDVVDEMRPPANQSDYLNKLLADRKSEQAQKPQPGPPPVTDAEPTPVEPVVEAQPVQEEGTQQGDEPAGEEVAGWKSPYEPSQESSATESVSVKPAPPPNAAPVQPAPTEADSETEKNSGDEPSQA